MKNKNLVAIALFLTIMTFSNLAFAWSVTFISRDLPSTGLQGSANNFSASIRYDSRIQGVPVPVDGNFHVEVSRLYGRPTVTSGSWASWTFTSTTGAMTGERAWVGNQRFLVFGEVQRDAQFIATAIGYGTGQNYIGTGPNVLTGVNFFRTVTIRNTGGITPNSN